MSAPKSMSQQGTPAAELSSLSEEEARLAKLELALLDRAAAVESTARQVQTDLEHVRSSLHALAHTAVHGEAESLFNRTLAMEAPPHLVSRETSEALDLRRRALSMRTSALRIEEEALQRRSAALTELRRSADELQQQSAALARRAQEDAERKQREADAALRAQEEARREAERAQAAAAPVAAAPVELTNRKPAESTSEPAPPAPAPVAAPPAAAQPRESSAAQRSYRRVGVQTEVSLVSESNFFAGFSQNLSEMGVFVATYTQLLPVGTEVALTLNLPSRPGMKVHGVVKWVRDATDRTPGVFPGMGILFEELSEADARAIKTFVEQREPLFWAE